MHEVLARLPPERFAALYEALPEQAAAALDAPIARMLNSRLATVRRRPLPMKLRALRALLVRERDDELALDMLRGYLLGPRKDLVVAFLDGTGVEHEDGQVAEDTPDVRSDPDDAGAGPAAPRNDPDPAKVPGVVKALLQDHERDDVRLYLEVASRQWPDCEAVAKELAALR